MLSRCSPCNGAQPRQELFPRSKPVGGVCCAPRQLSRPQNGGQRLRLYRIEPARLSAAAVKGGLTSLSGHTSFCRPFIFQLCSLLCICACHRFCRWRTASPLFTHFPAVATNSTEDSMEIARLVGAQQGANRSASPQITATAWPCHLLPPAAAPRRQQLHVPTLPRHAPSPRL